MSAEKPKKRVAQGAESRLGAQYFVKGATAVAILYALSLAVPVLPSFAVAVLWALLSAASALGVLYQVVLRKAHRGMKYAGGGFMSWINGGRMFSIIVSFVVSAVCMAGLVLESPKWDVAEWALIVAAVPVYWAVHLLCSRFIAHEYEPTFRKGSTVLWSCVIVALLLCLAYAGLVFLQPAQSYSSVLEAFTGTRNYFENSPSALLAEAGIFSWISDSSLNYVLAQVATSYMPAYLVMRLVLSVAAFSAVANILGLCALSHAELTCVFKPIEAASASHSHSHYKPVTRFVVAACVLPVALVAGFLYADSVAENVKQTSEYTWAESVARALAGQSVYQLNGVYYDREKVDALLNQVAENSITGQKGALAQAAEDVRSAINSAFDSAQGNIDTFLNWYFNLPSDKDELSKLRGSNAYAELRSQFSAQVLGDGASEIESALVAYVSQAVQAEQDIEEGLENSKVTMNTSFDWLLSAEELPSDNRLTQVLNTAKSALRSAEEAGVSQDEGSAEGLVATYIANAVFSSTDFKTMMGDAENVGEAAQNVVLNTFNALVGEKFSKATKYDGYKTSLQSSLQSARDQLLSLVASS